ncbi:MAG: hypothetical protein RL217_1416 [Pseudomonadota bacterium]
MKLDALLAQVGKSRAQPVPPVEKWQPAFSGDMDIVIRADGSWWHEGVKFERLELVNLFASILRHEQGEYFLVTPVEKWRIQVQDRPLFVSLVQAQADEISLLTTTNDALVLGAEHPLRLSQVQGVAVAEVRVRHDLWARFTRNAWYDLLECANETADGRFIVRSLGVVFELDCWH